MTDFSASDLDFIRSNTTSSGQPNAASTFNPNDQSFINSYSEPVQQQETAAPTAAQPDYGMPDFFARGATLSGFDRALAYTRSLRSGLPYQTELSHIDIQRQRYGDENPLKAGLAEAAGTLAPTVPGMGLVGNAIIDAGKALRAPAVARGLARLAGEGATAGTMLYPISEEKSPQSAALHGAESGMIFGPLGAVLAAPVKSHIAPNVAQAARDFQAQGMTVYPGQMAGGPAVARIFGTAPNEAQIDQLTRGVAKSFGFDTDTITSDLIRGPNGALQRAGAQIENAAQSSAGIPATDPQMLGNFHQLLLRAAQDFGGRDTEGYKRVLGLFGDIKDAAQSGNISGASYSNLTQKGSAIWNAQSRSSPIRQYAIELKQALDEALERNNPQQAQEIAQGRHAYHNALIAEDTVDANGKIDPKALARKVESNAGYGSMFRAKQKADQANLGANIGTLAEGSGMFLSGKQLSPTAFIHRHPFIGMAGAIGGERLVEALSTPAEHLMAEHPAVTGTGLGLGAAYAGLGAIASRPGYGNLLLSGIDPANGLARAPVPLGYQLYFGNGGQ